MNHYEEEKIQGDEHHNKKRLQDKESDNEEEDLEEKQPEIRAWVFSVFGFCFIMWFGDCSGT